MHLLFDVEGPSALHEKKIDRSLSQVASWPVFIFGGGESEAAPNGSAPPAGSAFRKEDFIMKNKKKKAKPVDTAMPIIRKPKHKDGDKISVTRATTTAMKASPTWNNAPTLQAVTTDWNANADAIEGNAKVIYDLRLKLAAAEANQRELRRNWNDVTRQVLATVATVCQGSADQVHQLGLDVLTHEALGPMPAPGGLGTAPGPLPGEAGFTWDRGSARHGFIVQHATDATNVSTVSAPIPCTKSKFTLAGAQSSTVVYFRVAAIDPTSATGQGPWSDWVAGTVS
jgi:hypothetical protein